MSRPSNVQSSQLRICETLVCLPLSRVRERGSGGEGRLPTGGQGSVGYLSTQIRSEWIQPSCQWNGQFLAHGWFTSVSTTL